MQGFKDERGWRGVSELTLILLYTKVGHVWPETKVKASSRMAVGRTPRGVKA